MVYSKQEDKHEPSSDAPTSVSVLGSSSTSGARMQRQIQVSGTWSGLVTLLTFSDSIEHEFKLSPEERYLMRLVVEEIASNIIKYGYSESHTGPIQLECRYHNDTLQLIIRD
ncbi:MAG: ATP-binding protein, partial [Chloroflexia bacterium]|nr:ATP-binding protein [Chloroflexia bacterium]